MITIRLLIVVSPYVSTIAAPHEFYSLRVCPPTEQAQTRSDLWPIVP